MAVANTPGATPPAAMQASAAAGAAAASGGRAAPVGAGAVPGVPTAGTTPPSAAGATASLPAAGTGTLTQPSAAGKPAGLPMAGAAGSVTQPAAAGAQGGSGGAGAPAETDGRIPCDVAKILFNRCHSCHGTPTNLGAPMSLVTWADLQKPAVSAPSRKVYELVAARVQDTMRPMPPAQDGKVAASDKTLLVDWCMKGAPSAPSSASVCPKN